MVKCPFRINAVPPMNAKTDFGADNCHADGATDDAAHLHACMDAAIAAGKRLYLPAGTYQLNSTVTVPTTLYMYGAGATTILTSLGATGGLRTADPSNTITLRDFTLTGNASTTLYGVYVDYGDTCTNLTLTNLDISDFTNAGVWFGGASNVSGLRATNVYCANNQFGFFHGTPSGSSTDLLFADCEAYNMVSIMSPPHGYYFHSIDNAHFINCIAHTIGEDVSENGNSGFEFDNASNIYLEGCDAHSAVHVSDYCGYGYIAVGSTTIEYHDCSGSDNAYDFYEYNLTGSATYSGTTTFPPYTKLIV